MDIAFSRCRMHNHRESRHDFNVCVRRAWPYVEIATCPTAGFCKLSRSAVVYAYIHAYSVSGALSWPADTRELSVGVLLTIGLRIRALSLPLAGCYLVTAFIFHIACSNASKPITYEDTTATGGGLFIA